MQIKHSPLVKVNAVAKRFGDVSAVDDLSMTIQPNEVVALLGENGAGKTTTISMLLGQQIPTAGEITIFGLTPGHWAAKQQLGVMLQSAALPDNVTVKEQLRLFASYYPNSISVEEAIQTAMLTQLEKRKIQTLSGGQKQRLLFAMAIIGNPKLVILDEPTVGLDASARREFWKCIRSLAENGTSVLLTTHYLEEADALSDRIVVMSHGKKVAEGVPAEIKAKLGGKRIRFRTQNSLDDIAALVPGCTPQHRGDYTEIFSATPEEHLNALLAGGIEMQDLSLSGISLEDAFLQLTHANLNTQQNNKDLTA